MSKLHYLLLLTFLFYAPHPLEAQIPPSGVLWGPVLKLSQDDPHPSGGNYSPYLAVQGDTIHCVWFGGSHRLPYNRSVDDGLSWDTVRDLLTDTVSFPSFSSWHHIVCRGDRTFIFFQGGLPNGETPVFYVYSSDGGTTWSSRIRASADTCVSLSSASVRGDTMAAVYTPIRNEVVFMPRITQSVDNGVFWSRSAQEMPSSELDQIRLALTPGLLNFFHWGERWPGPGPEIVRHRSTDLANNWQDSVVLSSMNGNGNDMPEVATFEQNGCSRPVSMAVMWRGEEYGGAMFSAGMAIRFSYHGGTSWHPIQVVSDVPFGSFHSVALRGSIAAAGWDYEEGDLYGPFHVKARVSFDGGSTWGAVTDLTPNASNAEIVTIALSDSAVHVAWEEVINNEWNIYYCRGKLLYPDVTLAATPSSLNCDTSDAGLTTRNALAISNSGTDTLKIGTVVSDTSVFAFTPQPFVVPPGTSDTAFVGFTPGGTGPFQGHLLMISNSGTYPICYTVNGVGRWHEEAIAYDTTGSWSLVSTPVRGGPGALHLSPLYAFQRGYVVEDSISFGSGYWAKPGASITYTGTAVLDSALIDLVKGWNLIGTITAPVEVSGIHSNPTGLVISNLYAFKGSSYFVADTLFPGRAYWVKSTENAQLVLPAIGTRTARNLVHIMPGGELPPPPPARRFSGLGLTRPQDFTLYQNFPNPFNPATNINFTLPRSGQVRLSVYNVFGQQVETLVDGWREKGENNVAWYADAYPSGVYFYRLVLWVRDERTQSATKAMMLLK